MLTDVAAIALALFAMSLARRPATPERTFGYLRAEILAALVNAVALIVMAIYIFWEAWHRLQDPPEVQSGPRCCWWRSPACCANIAAAWVLSRGGGHEHNLNTRGAFLHVLGDLLGSVATIVAAIVIATTGWFAADPILSARDRRSGRLQRVVAAARVRRSPARSGAEGDRHSPTCGSAIETAPGVDGVHDLHVWTVTSGFAALSAHIETRHLADWPETHDALADMLRDKFGIVHVTLQPESPRPRRDAGDHCSFDAPAGQAACLTARSALRAPPTRAIGIDIVTDLTIEEREVRAYARADAAHRERDLCSWP